MDGDYFHCDICELWLNGATQWEDHKICKRHKDNKKCQDKGLPKKRKADKKDRGVVIPLGTMYIIKQTAIYEDAMATTHYVLSLYQRAQLRARL